MKRGRRFLMYSAASLAAGAARRAVVRRDGQRPDPALGDHLGAIRGRPNEIRGPRASRMYTEWFPPGGSSRGVVVLTHGYCLTEAVWHYQKRDLAGGRFGMVTWDLPGHGMSPPLPRGRVTLDLAVEALERVIDRYADGPVVLVGHSLGGVVTLGYLTRRAARAAELVRGAVLISTPMMHFSRSVAGRWPGAALEARAIGGVLQFAVQSDLFDRVLSRDLGQEELSRLSYRLVRWGFGKDPSPSQVRFVRDMIASVEPDVRSDTFRIMTGYDLTPVLQDIKVPALVVLGAKDRLVNPHESRALAERLPRGRALVFPDAGHAAFLERPRRFNAEVRRFIDRRLDAGRAASRERDPGSSETGGQA
ncbi:MAG TPA: alpha/beta hydrolase [Actinomycetota bacterium]|nr:alpha/beta hydrolase [Actinomycetota bacterium]